MFSTKSVGINSCPSGKCWEEKLVSNSVNHWDYYKYEDKNDTLQFGNLNCKIKID